MRAIHKYEIKSNVTTIKIPEASRVLDIQYQNDRPMIWVEVDTDKESNSELFPLDITIVGTGIENANKFFSIHTYFKTLQEGRFVWHFYLCDVNKKFLGITKND